MPKSTNSVNLDLEDLLISKGYDVTPLDSSGKPLPTADQADIIQFHFHREGKDYGTVTISIDGLKNMTVYYDDEIANSGVNEDDMDADRGMNGTSWISLVKQLKKFAQRRQLGFVLKDADRLRIDMKRRKQNEKELREGAELKKVKREYNAAAKNSGGDWDGAGKKIDNMKKRLRQRDIGKDKTVAEGSYDLGDPNNIHTTIQRTTLTPGQEVVYNGKIVKVVKTRGSGLIEINTDKGKIAVKPSELIRDTRRRGYDLGDLNNIHSPKESSNLAEGYYGNKKMSFSEDIPTVTMIIKHYKKIEETDKRFRYIDKIFLETSDGERFGLPTKKTSQARMFARHIAEGGAYKDDRWSHLAEICEDLDNLGGFIRATRSSDKFTESAQRMIGEAVDKYNELRGTAKRLQTGRGYNSYFESYEPPVENDNDDDLLEVFKHSSVDGRIEKAMPTLNKLGIRRGKLEEADMFEQWADDLIDESLDIGGDRQMEAIIDLFTDDLPVGPNAEVAIGELADIIEDDELFDRLRKTAKIDPNSDARPHILAWMQEQEGREYRDLLANIDVDDDIKDGEDIGKDSESIEPEEVKPKKDKPAPDAGGEGGLPPLPPLPGGEKEGGLPPLPPLKEGDDTLASIKRLLGM